MTREYRSIFLADDWAHQCYFGWRVALDEPGLRVLTKRRAIVDRFLVLLSKVGHPRVDDCVRRLSGSLGLADIVVHDFEDEIDGERTIGGLCFRRAQQRELLLNTATFVLDLQKSEDALLAAMTPDYRRKIRKAEAAGVRVEAFDKPESDLVTRFIAAFVSFARDRGLNAANAKAISAMYADGRALLLVARKNGEISNFLHLYKAGNAASFMYGVNLLKVNDGTGQYLHWQAIRRLKADGVEWYDLGGVPSLDSLDGIYNFKKRFGGQLVLLGSEWRYTGRLAENGSAIMQALKRMSVICRR
jgi:hypothetical protein